MTSIKQGLEFPGRLLAGMGSTASSSTPEFVVSDDGRMGSSHGSNARLRVRRSCWDRLRIVADERRGERGRSPSLYVA